MAERAGHDIREARRVVVGFDGTPSSQITLEWAAREAVARECALRVVAGLTVPSTIARSGIAARQRESLTAAVDDVRRIHGTLGVDEVDAHANPRDALLAEAVGAELLVVGASTSTTGPRWLFDSIPRAAARRSSCPVVVLRGRPRPTVGQVVVGVDGSNAAAAALDWAIDEVNLHHADLTVVHAWHRSVGGNRSMRHDDLCRANAVCAFDVAVRYCRQRTRQPVEGTLVEGDAAQALVAASREADLLVLGSRGRSGFKTMLFGSVALAVVDDADCSVAVLHPHLRPAA